MKKILIADDERHVCEELKYIIEGDGNVKIVNICSTGVEALDQITRLQPDIVFLDIEMPG
jgi:YesN/AraC family two-component response regulator